MDKFNTRLEKQQVLSTPSFIALKLEFGKNHYLYKCTVLHLKEVNTFLFLKHIFFNLYD